MKQRIRASEKRRPKLWLVMLVVLGALLIGAGTLIASQIYKPKNVLEPKKNADTMAGADASGIVDADSVYANNMAVNFDPESNFRILEIVPYKGMAELGYLVNGEEPISMKALNDWLPDTYDSNNPVAGCNFASFIKKDGAAYSYFNASDGKYWNNNNILVENVIIPGLMNNSSLIDAFKDQSLDGSELSYGTTGPWDTLSNEEKIQYIRDFLAKEEMIGNTKHVMNRVDVVVVDPETLNNHSELIDNANFISIHEYSSKSSSVDLYESEILHPSIHREESVLYGQIADKFNLGSFTKNEAINRLANFEYKVVKDGSGYKTVRNDLNQEVVEKLYERTMTKNAATVLTAGIMGISKGQTEGSNIQNYYVNKVNHTRYSRGGSYTYCNNVLKLGVLLGTTDKDFFDNRTSKIGKINKELSYPNVEKSGGKYEIKTDEDKGLMVTTYGGLTWKDKTDSSYPYPAYWNVTQFYPSQNKLDEDWPNTFDSGEGKKIYEYLLKPAGKENVYINSFTASEFQNVVFNLSADSEFKNIYTEMISSIKIDAFKFIYKDTLRILEVEPYNYFHYYETYADKGKPYTTGSAITNMKKKSIENYRGLFWWMDPAAIEVTTMPIYEFIANIEDINAKYDVIYFGTLNDNAPELKNIANTNSSAIHPYKENYMTSQSYIKNYGYGESDAKPLYSTVGEKVGDDDKVRYSGNDLTERKYKQVLEFMDAGKVVLFGKNVFNTGSSKVYKKTLAEKSYLRKIAELNLGSSPYKNCIFGLDYDSSSESGSGKLYQKLNKTICQLEMTGLTTSTGEYPTIYGGSPDQDSTKFTGNDIKISFKINGQNSANGYRAALYIDINADGHYVGSKDSPQGSKTSEKVKGCVIRNMATNEVKTVADAKLEPGVEYCLEKNIATEVSKGDYVGIIPWKLEIVNRDNEAVRANEINYTVKKVDSAEQKKKINVLQINYVGSEEAALSGASTKKIQTATDVIMAYHHGKDDDDSKDVNAYFGGGVDSQGHKWPAMTAASDYNKINKTAAINASSYFRTDIKKVIGTAANPGEYDITVDFLDMDTQDKKIYHIGDKNTLKGNTVEELNANRCKVWKDDSSSDDNPETGTSYEEWKELLADFDMIIFGFADMQQTSNSQNFNKALLEFIDQGKSVIFSHDMVIDYDCHDAHYRISNYIGELRELCGMDRYDVLDANGEIRADLNSESGKGKYKTTTWGGIRVLPTHEKLNATKFKDILDLDKAYVADNSTYLRATGPDYNNKKSDSVYDRDSGETKDGPWTAITKKVKLTNEGQITKYPYDIMKYTFSNDVNKGCEDRTSKSSDSIAVAETHMQYFQLDLESDDMAVWFCLSDNTAKGQGFYSSRENDGRNSYYIYNKGNITYTGLGHCNEEGKAMSRDEVDLFINTMISAYRSVPTSPYAQVKNKTAVSSMKGSSHVYTINVLDDAKASGSEFENDGVEIKDGKCRVYFNIDSGTATTKYDDVPIYLGVVDDKHPDKMYEIYKTKTSNYKEDGTKLTDKMDPASGSSLTFGTKTMETLGGYEVKRHIDLAPTSSDPDYYIEVDVSDLRNGVLSLDMQVYFEYSADGKLVRNMEHSFVNLVPTILFNLE